MLDALAGITYCLTSRPSGTWWPEKENYKFDSKLDIFLRRWETSHRQWSSPILKQFHYELNNYERATSVSSFATESILSIFSTESLLYINVFYRFGLLEKVCTPLLSSTGENDSNIKVHKDLVMRHTSNNKYIIIAVVRLMWTKPICLLCWQRASPVLNCHMLIGDLKRENFPNIFSKS